MAWEPSPDAQQPGFAGYRLDYSTASDFSTSADAYTLSFPAYRTSEAGDYGRINHRLSPTPGTSKYELTFELEDGYEGPEDDSQYRFMRVLIDGEFVYSQDIIDWTAEPVTLDLTDSLKGKTHPVLSFEVYENQGVGNYAIDRRFSKVGRLPPAWPIRSCPACRCVNGCCHCPNGCATPSSTTARPSDSALRIVLDAVEQPLLPLGGRGYFGMGGWIFYPLES
jgi:hypothetical protein